MSSGDFVPALEEFFGSAAGLSALVGVLTVLAARLRTVAATVRSPRATVVGRAMLVAIVLVAIPGFVSTVADILGRGP